MYIPENPVLDLGVRDWTGRVWLTLCGGWFAVGFGPLRFVERIWFGGRCVWFNKRAAHEHRMRAIEYQVAKETRQAGT